MGAQGRSQTPLCCPLHLQPHPEILEISRLTDRPFALSGIMLRMTLSSICVVSVIASEAGR